MIKRILIADDHAAVRFCVKDIVQRQEGCIVCGEAADGVEAVSMAFELRPDLVILDIKMPLMNGFEAARQIRKMVPSTKILMFSLHDGHALLSSSDADAYLPKTASGEQLFEVVARLLSHRNNGTARAEPDIAIAAENPPESDANTP